MEPEWMNLLRDQALASPWVILEGRSAVEAAVAGWWEVAGVMIDETHPWENPAWSGLEVLRVAAVDLASLGQSERHAGVLGLAREPAETREVAAFAKSLPPDALLVVAPRPGDPFLAGMLVRHAEAVGAAGVMFGAEGVSPFSPAAIRASDGAVFRLPVRVADGGQLLRSLKAAAVDLTGWEPDEDRTGAPPAGGRRALVVGDPVAGLGAFWRAACDRRSGGDWEPILREMSTGTG